MTKRFSLPLALLVALAAAPLCAPAQESTGAPPAPSASPSAAPANATGRSNEFDGNWHGKIAPYLWLPGISGTLVFHHPALTESGNANINVNAGPNNYLSFLNSGALIAGEINKGSFNTYADLLFLNLSHNGNPSTTITGPDGHVEIPLTSAIGWHVNTTMWEVEPGWTLAHGDAGILDAEVGVRSISLTTAANWTFTGPIDLVPLTGQDSASVTITDFIYGIRGNLSLGGHWFAPYYGDLGSGGGNTTSQWYVGAGYAQKYVNWVLFYRDLNYNQTTSDARLQNIQLAGLGFGAVFKL